MSIHFGVFPSDFVQSLSAVLGADNNLQYLYLPHPRTGIPSLFLPYNDIEGGSKLLEVQAVSPGNSRSWFMAEEVVSDGKLLVVTQIDPVFILIPLLERVQQNRMSSNFRPVDDTFEDIANAVKTTPSQEGDGEPVIISVSVDDTRLFLSLDCTHHALKRICEVKDVTPELSVYRYSPSKALECLQKKVSQLSSPDVLNSSRTITRGFAKDGLMDDGKEKLLNMAHTRAACDLISQYLSPDMHKALLASYDLQDLDLHLRQSVAQAIGSSTNGAPAKSKVKTHAVAASEKKRKNAKGSHGVEKLKKANVNGMAKLSSFFKKTEAP